MPPNFSLLSQYSLPSPSIPPVPIHTNPQSTRRIYSISTFQEDALHPLLELFLLLRLESTPIYFIHAEYMWLARLYSVVSIIGKNKYACIARMDQWVKLLVMQMR